MALLSVFLATLLAIQPCFAQQAPFLDDLGSNFGAAGDTTYDYVVVGGGTAGNTIAARLAEDPSVSVALVEAGTFYQIADGNRSVVPFFAFSSNGLIQRAPVTDWGFNTVPGAGLLNRSIDYARGRVLSGSSGLNFLIYHRPTRESLDLWADQVGDQSYSWDNILPYYKKSTTFTPPDEATTPANSTPSFSESAYDNSVGGPLQISYGKYTPPTLSYFLDGFSEIGIEPNDDLNSGDLLGANWAQSVINPSNSHRSSSQTSFLNQAIANTSLTIYTDTLARRILFSDDKVATGVEVTAGRATYSLSARKEVILSAGAFQSPQLLMVSGIGPEATLSKFDIPVISPLKGVGQGLQDHPIFSVGTAVNIPSSTRFQSPSAPEYSTATEQYLADRTGPLSAGKFLIGWEKIPSPQRTAMSNTTLTALATFPADWPEIELRVAPYYDGLKPQDPDTSYAQVYVQVITSLSRGSVTISSNSTTDLPVIDTALFTDPADMELAIAAVKRIRELFASEAVSPILQGPEFDPGPNVTSDADIENFIRSTAGTIFNAAATTKMGTADDPMAVVNSKAQVFGVTGLRVVDTGAMPFLPPGHAQSSAYMIAEKIADEIKAAA